MAYSDDEFLQAERLWACAELIRDQGKGQYNDWYSVTLFYSALHYCRAALFQRDAAGASLIHALNSFDDFDEYCAEQERKSNLSKHTRAAGLVAQYFPEIKSSYTKLRSIADGKRYSQYTITNEEVTSVMTAAHTIRQFVTQRRNRSSVTTAKP